jgi:hypothetical protein
VSFAAITLCVASERVFIVVYLVTDSVRKLLDYIPRRLLLVVTMNQLSVCLEELKGLLNGTHVASVSISNRVTFIGETCR